MSQPNWTISPIAFSDRHLLVVNKPAGLLSHPNPGKGGGNCVFSGNYMVKERCFVQGTDRLWLVHRIDQDTSGLLWAARTEEATRKSRELFEAGRVVKQYTAMLHGRVLPKETWSDALETSLGKGAARTRVRRTGPPNAHAKASVIRAFPALNLSLVQILLLTGKTHQIRVQTAHRRHPVIGDDVYGDFPLNKELRAKLGLKSMFLHASQLEFPHPVTGVKVRVTADLPAELTQVLDKLAQSG